jgi:hypothetical protein
VDPPARGVAGRILRGHEHGVGRRVGCSQFSLPVASTAPLQRNRAGAGAARSRGLNSVPAEPRGCASERPHSSETARQHRCSRETCCRAFSRVTTGRPRAGRGQGAREVRRMPNSC